MYMTGPFFCRILVTLDMDTLGCLFIMYSLILRSPSRSRYGDGKIFLRCEF